MENVIKVIEISDNDRWNSAIFFILSLFYEKVLDKFRIFCNNNYCDAGEEERSGSCQQRAYIKTLARIRRDIAESSD